ncbi:MAG: pentapeptide repeat-containing protein [Roseibacillus sp.]|nr:pentapeptide repeat-containing protein [Roseibacillus sp.]
MKGEANLSGADLRDANLSGADLRYAVLFDADLRGADLRRASIESRGNITIDLGALLGGISNGNYEEIQALQPQVETNTTEIAQLNILRPQVEENAADIGQLNILRSVVETNTTEIAELKTMMEAMSVQMQQLNARLDDQQASIEEKDQQITELSQRPTLAEVQDARAGSLVFRADEATNAVTLEFEIQSSENLQDWVAQPETVTATVPLDAEKKFVRIALAQECDLVPLNWAIVNERF